MKSFLVNLFKDSTDKKSIHSYANVFGALHDEYDGKQFACWALISVGRNPLSIYALF